MDFFEISKRFPAEERYALSSQGRQDAAINARASGEVPNT